LLSNFKVELAKIQNRLQFFWTLLIHHASSLKIIQLGTSFDAYHNMK